MDHELNISSPLPCLARSLARWLAGLLVLTFIQSYLHAHHVVVGFDSASVGYCGILLTFVEIIAEFLQC